MKNLKKTIAALIVAAMTMATLTVPAMAESLKDVSYSAAEYG